MEEELNENELEERLYAMLHHVDETQANVNKASQNQNDIARFIESLPRSTVPRYWRTPPEYNTRYKLTNQKESALTYNNTNNSKPKEEKQTSTIPPASVDLSIFQSPVPHIINKTIEILELEDDNHVVLETSDEDEVVEVMLPPKPTITIESSDEDELRMVKPNSPVKSQLKLISDKSYGERDVTSSPVPSVVSSVSDDFIRGDCIALNISSRRPDNHSFDFSLHGFDLLDQNTPSKKKKKKKSKEVMASTPISAPSDAFVLNFADEYFATPKSKAKNKKQKAKSYVISEKRVPNADIYDSDSNQSVVSTNKTKNTYIVTDKSLPSADVYESDSNQSEKVTETNMQQFKPSIDVDSSDSSICLDNIEETLKNKDDSIQNKTFQNISVVDLTGNEKFVTLDDTGICESIVMANVTGFRESENYEDENISRMSIMDISKFGSTKVPAILNEDLDFDNLKGKEKICKRRKYSLTTLRAEMEKFYNESWGGEDFNHREIQKNMSRDKSLWVIDPKDRMPSMGRRKTTCNYCNRPGHRDDACRAKPAVCYMCGSTGHFESRCPSKICVNCGTPNYMYSTMCRNCSTWGRVICAECGQHGHPSSHCPDLWRRYHNTIDINMPLERNCYTKKPNQFYCSGCTRRGHLVHSCRQSLPFSGLPINTPYVCIYHPLFAQSVNQDFTNNQRSNQQLLNKGFSQDSTVSSASIPLRSDRNKRQSKSPTAHDSHFNKKRYFNNISIIEDIDVNRTTKSPANNVAQKNTFQNKEQMEDNKNRNGNFDPSKTVDTGSEIAPDFIPIYSTNRDKKGLMIQDNQVSDTSDVTTLSRIYVTNDIIDKTKTNEGQEWLKQTTEKYNVTVQHTDMNTFLSIKGKLADQEAFQSELKDWTKFKSNNENKQNVEDDKSEESKNDQSSNSVPKNRNNLLRQLNKALDSLKEDIGDPKAIYKELTYSQNRHEQLLKQKVISPKQLNNSRSHINDTLKKLNMVLLGQAGLANGSEHVNELYSFKEKLINFRQKNIPSELRKEIGQHYHTIFTPRPRNDYVELLNKYYVSKQSDAFYKKKKKDKSFNGNPKISNITNKVNGIPSHQMHGNIARDAKMGGFAGNDTHLKKLVFYHRRLLNTRPSGTGSKKTRADLVSKLHSYIASIYRRENMSPKTLKKVRKTQAQAQMFLANV